MDINTIHLADNLEYTKTLPDDCADAIITDSPYGLGKEPDAVKCIEDWVTKGYHEVKGKGFMGKSWDAFVPQPILWKECFRVLKPGGHLLSFFGTRTYDWGTLAIRLAGFEIRDKIDWFHNNDEICQKFLSSLSEEQKKLFKSIVKTDAGQLAWIYGSGFPKSKSTLKPANEPICVARKPGPLQMLNIDECRIEMKEGDRKGEFGDHSPNACGFKINDNNIFGKGILRLTADNSCGRWPSNVILDEETAELLDEQTGVLNKSIRKQGSIRVKERPQNTHMKTFDALPKESYNDFGGASRFFYVAKASPSERKGNPHPTVKPVKLITQLVKLYCPIGGIVYDPHMGSGTTCEASEMTGRNYIAVDNDPFSYDIAKRRLQNSVHQLELIA